MKVKLLEPIEGFEDVAEFKFCELGDVAYCLKFKRGIRVTTQELGLSKLVLTPIKRWRPATIDDAVRAIRGETIKARFRDYESDDWKEALLGTYLPLAEYPWIARNGVLFKFCEVLDA